MSKIAGWGRRQLAGVVALVLLVGMFVASRLPEASADERAEMASGYRFTPLSIDIPGGFPQQTIRRVNKDYEHIRAWISSVGAGIAMNDLDGDGLANDLCVTDVRIDRVVVTPTPGAGASRYAAFALDPSPLPMNPYIAPMGCVPGDYNEDGRNDLLVYWWGRTPVIYLAKPGATGLSMATYQPVELVPRAGTATSVYDGPQWNTNAVAVADFDGDGHDDIYVGNYFPDGPVINDTVAGGVAMNDSMSLAYNGGLDHVFRWTGGTTGDRPGATYAEAEGVFPEDVSRGWVLAAGGNDLDGDLLPELYMANDFGPDRLMHNRSTPGKVRFTLVEGTGSRAVVPKSKLLGHDSFKGMGVDFGDIDGDGLYDMYVGNITTTFGLQESNFAFVNTADDQAHVRAQLGDGKAPFADRSAPLGLAWSGWSWDVKFGDFDNSGEADIVQTAGFVKGEVNRWAQLQELATANDGLLKHPLWWPKVEQGDDIAGGQALAFHVKGPSGRFEDLSAELDLDERIPTRGIATGDADGDGRLDFAVARQWDAPVFYRNESPQVGAFLGLRLVHEAGGSAATGAQVTVTGPDGRRHVGRVDAGSGHSGKRSFEVHVGLGETSGPLTVDLAWRDRTGAPRQQRLQLTPGWHTVRVGTQAQEVAS
ncbi:FG-GAP-like repeat-containing protein [Phytohabitans houttuyneae]|uniref:RNA-binding protein n=1 Tax=Phytohabitans houttuyneae TaxID=1076126 RepID=A0A6V8K3K0_9ACTN|nr:RNA-binding protein [Phytohabitans houttuyneae]